MIRSAVLLSLELFRLSDDAPIYDFDCDADIATRSTLNAAPL